MESAAENNFYKKKYPSTVAFIVASLLFLLPFVEIRCNDTPYAENSGMGLAFGTDYKTTGQVRKLNDSFYNRDTDSAKVSKENGKMYPVALGALILGLLGIALSLTSVRAGMINTIVGIVAALLLIVLMIQVKMDVKDVTNTETSEDDVSNAIRVTAAFTAWYYLSLLSFLAAAFFSYKQGQSVTVLNRPPKHAPQVPLHNPGEQSEFPTQPDESELER
jgi:amino acid transporter